MCKEQWFLIPRGEISLLEIRSKIERQGVQREVRKSFSFFVCISGLLVKNSTKK